MLRTIIRHLVASVQILTGKPSLYIPAALPESEGINKANDFPFVMRMVVQSLLPGSPPDLSEEGHRLSAIVQASLPVPAVNTFNELCPACRVEVPLQDITTAVCSNGHTWGGSCYVLCSSSNLILVGSSVLNYNVHPLDAASAHVYWVQQEGIPPVINAECSGHPKLAASCCTRLGSGGALGGCSSLSVL